MQTKHLQFLAVSSLAVACVAHPTHSSPDYVNYTTVTGFFLQDEATTVPGTFDYTSTNFGLINRTYSTDKDERKSLTQWQKFENYVVSLNDHSGNNVEYKVLFMGRHGEGYHNVAETYYGTPAWNVSKISTCPTHNSNENAVLLVSIRRKWNFHLGRRRHNTQRSSSSSNRRRLLGIPNCSPKNPHPSIFLHLTPNPLPKNGQHHVFSAPSSSWCAFQAHSKGKLPRGHQWTHLRSTANKILYP